MFPAAALTPINFFTGSALYPLPTFALVLTTAWYLWSLRRLSARGRDWPLYRTSSFLAAEVLLAVALLSGLAAPDRTGFTDHAVRDILLTMVIPLLVAVSAPVTLLLGAGGTRTRAAVSDALHGPAGRILSNPFVTWALFGASLFGLYLSGLYANTVTNDAARELVRLQLLVAGCLFYWPVIAADPRRLGYGTKILYLMMSLPFYSILGMALESQTSPIAPGVGLRDLHAGGGIIWIAGEAIGLVGAIVVFVQWLRADESRARRADRLTEEAAERQLALWRASREAAARAASM